MHFRVLDCAGWCDQGNILKIITSFLRAPTGCRARKHGQSVPQRDVHDSVEFCEHQHHECSRFAASERSTILWVSLDMGLFLSLVIILSFTLVLCEPCVKSAARCRAARHDSSHTGTVCRLNLPFSLQLFLLLAPRNPYVDSFQILAKRQLSISV